VPHVPTTTGANAAIFPPYQRSGRLNIGCDRSQNAALAILVLTIVLQLSPNAVVCHLPLPQLSLLKPSHGFCHRPIRGVETDSHS
jgi:hypothetical protein